MGIQGACNCEELAVHGTLSQPCQEPICVDLSFIVEPKHPRMTGQDRILSRASVFRSEHGHAKGQSRDGEMKAYSHGPFRTGNEFSHEERMRPARKLYQSWHIAQHIIVIAEDRPHAQ